jgi:hypothetical protein
VSTRPGDGRPGRWPLDAHGRRPRVRSIAAGGPLPGAEPIDEHALCPRCTLDRRHHGFFALDRSARKPTYYLGVYLLLGHKTGWPRSFAAGRRQEVERMLLSMQNDDGGWPTVYATRNGSVSWTNGHANVETTSLVVYAFIDPAAYHRR